MKWRLVTILIAGLFLVGCEDDPPAPDPGTDAPPPRTNTPDKPDPDSQEPSSPDEPQAEVTISPAETEREPKLTWDPQTGELVAVHQPLIAVLRAAWPRNEYLHDAKALPDGRFDVTVAAQRNALTAWRKLQAAVEKRFDVEMLLQDYPMDLYVLRQRPDAPLLMTRSQNQRPGQSIDLAQGWSFQGGSGESLAWRLERILGRPVVDETDLTDYYDFLLPMQHDEPESAIGGVEALGLELVEDRRDLRVVLIRPRRED
jgi:uncharacterized protein (TIGR03435 family)